MAITKLPTPKDAALHLALGKDFILDVNTGVDEDTPTWTAVGGQRTTKLSRQADEIDTSHKTSGSWKDSAAGLRSWSMEADAVVIIDDKGAEAVDFAFTNGQPVHCRFRYPDGTNYIGWAAVTEFSIDTSHTDVATLSIKLSGKGPLKQGTKITAGG